MNTCCRLFFHRLFNFCCRSCSTTFPPPLIVGHRDKLVRGVCFQLAIFRISTHGKQDAYPTYPHTETTVGTMSKRLYIETVGCQMNVLDSELVVASLRQHGYDLAPDAQSADTILFNTCSVRQHAEEKVYTHLVDCGD